MMGPTLLQPPGGASYDDTELRDRVGDVEGRLGAKASAASVTAVSNRVKTLEERDIVDQTARDAASAAQTTANGRATVASVAAVANRITTLEQAGGSGGGSGAAGPYVPFLVGVHEILSGTTFNKAALLGASFMAGVDPKHCRVDLYLVGGGQAGWSRTSSSSSFQSPGGRPGSVRIVRGLSFDDLVDGTSIAVGAGSLNRLGDSGFSGGDTTFGSYRARGGQYNLNNETVEDTSDERLGRPGSTGITATPGTVTAQAGVNARISLGPGAGGGATGTLWGFGGPSNPDDARRARVTPSANGAAGQSADAGTLAYGSGGAGGNGANGGNGGFPGGGGGSTCGGTEMPAGNGGNGVIRFAVHQYRTPA